MQQSLMSAQPKQPRDLGSRPARCATAPATCSPLQDVGFLCASALICTSACQKILYALPRPPELRRIYGDILWAHATQRRFMMCHEWRVGDLLMWNNLSVLHRRDPFDRTSRRLMHRAQIKGDERIA